MKLEFDAAKDEANVAKHGLSLAYAMLVYGAPNKITLRSVRTGEERLVDVAMVAVAGVVLVLVYVVRGTVVRAISLRWASRIERGCMNKPNKTNWKRVKAEADKPVWFDPETDPYDPNDEDAVATFWAEAEVVRPGRPPVAVKRPTLNMRVDADVLEHLRASGKGWQTRVNAVLRDAVEHGRL